MSEDHRIHSKQERSILANGKVALEMARVNRDGQMALPMLVNGVKIELMAEVNLSM